MITAVVMEMFTFMLNGMLDSLPNAVVPAWLSSAGSYLPSVFAFAASMGVWFPWSVLGIVLASVFSVWGASFLFKILRIVISHVTGGGGSAA